MAAGIGLCACAAEAAAAGGLLGHLWTRVTPHSPDTYILWARRTPGAAHPLCSGPKAGQANMVYEFPAAHLSLIPKISIS